MNYETDERKKSLQGKRVIKISDSVMSYFAVLPAGMTKRQAVADFVETYSFNQDTDDETSREELESGLLDEIYAEIFDPFYARSNNPAIPRNKWISGKVMITKSGTVKFKRGR